MKEYKADLHIHTCLSPCADDCMAPQTIVNEAVRKNLDIIGICDHNSAENAAAAVKAVKGKQISVIGGIEATSEEEIHVLALFDDPESLFGFQELIYKNLPGKNDEKFFGSQLIVDENNEITGRSDKLLIGATALPIDKIVRTVNSMGGLAIAAHVDRERFSIISQLGFIPDGLALDALELSPGINRSAVNSYDFGFPLVTFSDAHYPEDIGKSHTVFIMEDATTGEMRKALAGVNGRSVRLG